MLKLKSSYETRLLPKAQKSRAALDRDIDKTTGISQTMLPRSASETINMLKFRGYNIKIRGILGTFHCRTLLDRLYDFCTICRIQRRTQFSLVSHGSD